MKKIFSEFIKESIIDIPKQSLDATVFDFYDDKLPTLKTGIRVQIAKDIDRIEEIVPVRRFYMVGSILSRHYNKDCDIDITVDVYEKNVNDILETKLLKFINELNGSLAIGTTHPINYYINVSDDEIDEHRYDAIYDIINQRWIKQTKDLDINIGKYLKKFQDVVSRIDLVTAKLRRDIIDFKELTTFNKDEIKNLKQMLQSKIYEINKDIEKLVDFKKTIKKKREEDFTRPLSPDEIEKFQSRNKLPSNVIYKLLEKYYYWDFIKRLEKILEDDEKIDIKDIEKISKAENELFSEAIESFTGGQKIHSDTVIFGHFKQKTGDIYLHQGEKDNDHYTLGMMEDNIEDYCNFRYLPATKIIYWWVSNKEAKIAAEKILKKHGFPVIGHKNLIKDKDAYKITHYPAKNSRDAEEGMKPTHESFKQFVLREDSKPIEKADEKIKIKEPEPPSLKIQNRKDGKVIPDYKSIDPNRGIVDKFLKPYLARPSFNPVKLGLITMPSGETINIVDMLVQAFPPTNQLTDQEPIKKLGNTGIMLYKVGENFYMKKG
jgi:hypothetical protein